MRQIQATRIAAALAYAGANPLVWVTAALCVVYLPVFLGEIVFFRDPAHWIYPARYFVRAALLRGDSPFWNPDVGLGFPVLANPLYGIFYPPNWLYLLTPEDLVASMTTWQGLAHLIWGSAGMVVLARGLGISPLGAGVAGIAWGLSGHTTSAWSAGILLLAAAHVPWCGVGFLALARAARSDGRALAGGIAKAALPPALALLLGEVFVAMMGAGFGIATAVVAARWPPRADAGSHVTAVTVPTRQTLRLVGGMAAALCLATGVAAVVLVPARSLAGATARAAPLSRDDAELCSLHPLRLIEMAARGSMGYPGEYPAAHYIGEPRMDGDPLYYSVYLGAGVVALALAAFGRGRKLCAALGALAGAALLLGLGRHTPVHHWFRTVVRPFAFMRYPEKYLVLFVAWWSLVAGFGAARLAERRADGPDIGTDLGRRQLVWLLVLALVAVSGPPIFPEGWGAHVFWGGVWGLVTAGLVLGAQLLVGRRRKGSGALLVLCVSADLAAAAFPYLGFGPAEVATRTPRAASAIVEDHVARGGGPAPSRVYRANAAEGITRRFVSAYSYAQSEARTMQTLIANTVTTFGIAAVPGYDVAIPSRLREVWSEGKEEAPGVLRLLGANYAVLPIKNPRDPVERRAWLDPMLDPLPGARLYRVPGALPRVYLAGRVEVLSDDRARARLFDPQVVEGGLALLAPSGGAPEEDGPGVRAGTCTLESFSNRRVVARCRGERPALAVFVEQYDAGWRAEIDGRPAALLRANLLMRAVRVEAGTHTVALSYTPPHIGAAASVSLTALAAIGLLALWGRRGRSGAHAPG